MNFGTIFVLVWSLLFSHALIADWGKTYLKGPFNDGMHPIHEGCHWRVEYLIAPDGMPASRVWPAVLCFHLAASNELHAIPESGTTP
jgi:hypothetical protein